VNVRIVPERDECRRERKQVRDRDPGDKGDARTIVFRNGGKRNVDDGGIKGAHERRDRDENNEDMLAGRGLKKFCCAGHGILFSFFIFQAL